MSAVHSEETKAEVARLCKDGMSASEIGAQMGLSRNTIVGLAYRNRDKIQLHGAPTGGVPKGYKPVQVMVVQKPTYMQCESVDDAPFPLITLDELDPSSCRFPFGDRDFKFCGRPKFGDLPYCAKHCRICFNPRG